jgi:hypothetical protein
MQFTGQKAEQPVQRVYWPENVIDWLGKWRPTCVMRNARGQKLQSFRRKWPFYMDLYSMVQAKSLEILQRLEQEKLRIQQEEIRVKLEMEIAKSAAKEKALAALQIPQSTTTSTSTSTNLDDVRQSPAVVKNPPRHQTPRPHSTGRKLPQLPLSKGVINRNENC